MTSSTQLRSTYCAQAAMSTRISVADAAAKQTIQGVNNTIYGVIFPIVCAFGILGNILNLITLRSPLLQAVSYMYLRALAIADLLCMCFVLEFVIKVSEVASVNVWYQAHLELPLINVFIAAGVLTVLALTVERYISVVFPVYFRDWNKPMRAKIIIFSAYLLSFILWFPMCFERRVCLKYDQNKNLTIDAQEEDQSVRATKLYEAYKGIREIVMKGVPVFGLIYFNLHIIVAFRRVQQRRKAMVNRCSKAINESRATDDRRLIVLLASIAVLFFVCNLPAAINLLIIKDALKYNVPYQVFRAVANMLEVSNHAVNFYIFCMCSKDYRQEFLATFAVFRRLRTVCRKFRGRVKHHVEDTSSSRKEKRALLASEATSALIGSEPEPKPSRNRNKPELTHTIANGKLGPPPTSHQGAAAAASEMNGITQRNRGKDSDDFSQINHNKVTNENEAPAVMCTSLSVMSQSQIAGLDHMEMKDSFYQAVSPETPKQTTNLEYDVEYVNPPTIQHQVVSITESQSDVQHSLETHLVNDAVSASLADDKIQFPQCNGHSFSTRITPERATTTSFHDPGTRREIVIQPLTHRKPCRAQSPPPTVIFKRTEWRI